MNFKLKIILIFVSFAVSCASKKNFATKKQNILTLENSQIFFLMFNIQKNLNSNINQVKLIKTIKIDGILKKDFKTDGSIDNYLTLEVYSKKQLIKKIVINHPLFKDIEYSDENNIMNKKRIELNSENFSFRLQVSSADLGFKIKEKLKDKIEIELLSQKI